MQFRLVSHGDMVGVGQEIDGVKVSFAQPGSDGSSFFKAQTYGPKLFVS